MKLSEVKGDRVFDVIAEIIEPVSSMLADPNVKELFCKKEVPSGMTAEEFVSSRVTKCVPSILKDHKADIITVMAAIEGKANEEYEEELTLAKLLKDVTELLTDKDFLAFFS